MSAWRLCSLRNRHQILASRINQVARVETLSAIRARPFARVTSNHYFPNVSTAPRRTKPECLMLAILILAQYEMSLRDDESLNVTTDARTRPDSVRAHTISIASTNRRAKGRECRCAIVCKGAFTYNPAIIVKWLTAVRGAVEACAQTWLH